MDLSQCCLARHTSCVSCGKTITLTCCLAFYCVTGTTCFNDLGLLISTGVQIPNSIIPEEQSTKSAWYIDNINMLVVLTFMLEKQHTTQ